MRTSFTGHESSLLDWARPRVLQDGPPPVQFTVAAGGDLIVPPVMGGARSVLLDGSDMRTGEPMRAEGVIDEEQFAWEPYNLAEEHARLEAEHDAVRSAPGGARMRARRPRYSEERAGLYTAFARLPVLGEGIPRDKVASEYVAWCNSYGSPGLFDFLYAPGGQRLGTRYVRERRTGNLTTEDQFYVKYPEADVGDERHREPVRVEWLSREVELVRHTLTLCAASSGADVTAGVDAAREALGESLSFDAGGASVSLPDYREGVYRQRRWRHDSSLGYDVVEYDDSVLARWLWAHSGGSRLAPTRDPSSGTTVGVRVFDNFMRAVYFFILDDVTHGQELRRCADPKCRVFFRPKRGGAYHDLSCRTRVRLENDRMGARIALELRDEGVSTQAIAKRLRERLGERWTLAKTKRELRDALDARKAREGASKTAGSQPKGGSQ